MSSTVTNSRILNVLVNLGFIFWCLIDDGDELDYMQALLMKSTLLKLLLLLPGELRLPGPLRLLFTMSKGQWLNPLINF